MSTSSNDRVKMVAFAGLVAVLAAAGIYLTMSPPPQAGRDEPGERAVSATTAVSTPAPSPAPSRVATTPPTFDVYAYLPLSREELGAAADLARRFTAAYGTFRHDEDPVTVAERLKAFATQELGEQLTRAVTDPAAVQQNRADQVVSQGSAKVSLIRDMSAQQVTFVVRLTRRVTDTRGQREENDDYAVTVIRVGDDWRVYDIQPASAGQEGDSAP